MGFRCGIVGLPNVGKSTIFNALTRTAQAAAENYPFCTIEPNVGEVAVPDARLDKLAEIAKSRQVIPTRMTFVDIAGLVKGAALVSMDCHSDLSKEASFSISPERIDSAAVRMINPSVLSDSSGDRSSTICRSRCLSSSASIL